MESKPRLLAVDDIPANLVALDAVLGNKYELVNAHSGQEAIAILQRDTAFDVILMDIQMPIMDGYEAATRIKQLPGCDEIPLVFITAIYREDPQMKRGYEVGAVDYFTKPFDPDILRLKVDVYASFRRRSAMMKARERQLEESEAVLRAGRKLEALLAGLPVGVIIADVAGRMCQVNEEALRILRSTPAIDGDAYGRVLEWWDRNESHLKAEGSALARTLQSGQPCRNQVVSIVCVDGSTRSLLESISPLRGLDGAVVGAVVLLHDVSERKKIAADFEDQIGRLVALGVGLEQRAPG